MQSPHESSMDPMDFGVQRSRSQCKDYWKWFLAHNCFPFTPIFMKLHMQSPHESSMDPMDFGVQRSRSQCKDYQKRILAHNCFPIWCITWIVWIGCRGGYFVPLGQPHSSLTLLPPGASVFHKHMSSYLYRISGNFGAMEIGFIGGWQKYAKMKTANISSCKSLKCLKLNCIIV